MFKKKPCTQMFIAALFTIPPNWKQSKRPPMGYVRQLEEPQRHDTNRSQHQKMMYCMIPFTVPDVPEKITWFQTYVVRLIILIL